MKIEISVEVIDARISEGVTLIDKARIREPTIVYHERHEMEYVPAKTTNNCDRLATKI